MTPPDTTRTKRNNLREDIIGFFIALAVLVALSGLVVGITRIASGGDAEPAPPPQHRQFIGQYSVFPIGRTTGADDIEKWLETGQQAGYHLCQATDDHFVMCRDREPAPFN